MNIPLGYKTNTSANMYIKDVYVDKCTDLYLKD